MRALMLMLGLLLATAGHGQEGGFRLGELLGGGGSGFARALAPRPFVFPADHGPHPHFRSEWWYFTGNLETAGGRHFGYELTFFRFALRPDPPRRSSAFASNQVYMAHFALTDTAGHRFHAYERLGRAALGLAGARAQPFAVWLRDWRAASTGADFFPLRLQAVGEEVALDLTLSGGKPWVLQGDRGLSRKSDVPGNASYYYSGTRLAGSGTVTVAGETYPVRGDSWFDREWSTSALGPEQAGWDWFALQLDDGRDLMVYRLRRRDGTVDPHSAGVLVDEEGRATPLAAEAIALEVLDHWRSPETGVTYPSRWRLELPGEGLVLELTPRLAAQEITGTVRYWEGAVAVKGTRHGGPVAGVGYAELAGYR